MLGVYFFFVGTLLLSLNFVRLQGLAISDWFYLLSIIYFLVEMMLVRKNNLRIWISNHFIWAVGLILFGAILSTFNSNSPGIALFEILQQLFVMTLFVSACWQIVYRNKTQNILVAFILSGFFAATVVAMDYFFGSRIGLVLSGTPDINLWGRYAGPLRHPNKLGYFLALTSLITLAFSLAKRNAYALPKKVLWILLFVVQLFALYLSGSVTGYVGFLIGIFLLLSKQVFQQKQPSFIVVIVIGILLLIPLGGTLLSVPSYHHQTPSMFLAANIERVQNITAGQRVDVYQQAWRKILESPVLGVGYDQLSTSGIKSENRLLSTTVHNALLQIWYVGGIFAFIGWVTIYLKLIKMSSTIFLIKMNSNVVLLGSAIATIVAIVMDQFQDMIYQREKWLVFGLLSGLIWERLHQFYLKSEAKS